MGTKIKNFITKGMEKICTFALGKSSATSSLLILQDGNVAKVEGCSGATGVACPLLFSSNAFIETFIFR
jgi:hypothetical protein